MIDTALHLKETLIYTGNNSIQNAFKENMIWEFEWTVLIDLKHIFEVFVKPTIKLQAETYTTLNKGLLYIYSIYNKLEKLIAKYEKSIKDNEFFVKFYFFTLFLFYLYINY